MICNIFSTFASTVYYCILGYCEVYVSCTRKLSFWLLDPSSLMCFVCGYKIVDFCDFAKVVAKYLYTCLEFFSDPLKYLEKKADFIPYEGYKE